MKKKFSELSSKLILVIILVLVFNTNVFAADMDVIVTLNDDTIHLNKTVNSSSVSGKIDPGDGLYYSIKIKNDTSKNINLYFVEITESITAKKMNEITLEIYIDGTLYITGNANIIAEDYIYSITPSQEIEVTIRVGLCTTAGNEFQKSSFNITWKIGVIDKLKEIENKEDDEEIGLGIIEEIEEVEENETSDNNQNKHNLSETGKITIIPKTGESRKIYIILSVLIATTLIYIAIILLRKDKQEETVSTNEGDNKVDEKDNQ